MSSVIGPSQYASNARQSLIATNWCFTPGGTLIESPGPSRVSSVVPDAGHIFTSSSPRST